jgi:hypothetical protein
MKGSQLGSIRSVTLLAGSKCSANPIVIQPAKCSRPPVNVLVISHANCKHRAFARESVNFTDPLHNQLKPVGNAIHQRLLYLPNVSSAYPSVVAHCKQGKESDRSKLEF